MKPPVQDVIAKRAAARAARRDARRAAESVPSAKRRKATSTPSFRALAVRAVIAIFLVLGLMYGLNIVMPLLFKWLGGGS